jgi:hypothetical protein
MNAVMPMKHIIAWQIEIVISFMAPPILWLLQLITIAVVHCHYFGFGAVL